MKQIRCLAVLLTLAALFTGCGKQTKATEKTDGVDFGENQIAVVLSDGTGTAGDTVSMTVSVYHNPGIAGFSFCVKIPEGCSIENEAVTMEDNSYTYTSRKNEENAVNFAWTNLTKSTENRTIATFDLVLGDDLPAGEYPIELLFREGYDVFYTITADNSLPEYEVVPFNGVLTVK